MSLALKPIGIIHSPHTNKDKTPIQPVFAKEFTGSVELFPEYSQGLKDLEGFSHIYLIYHLHKSEGFKLLSKPFLDTVERGVFSTRSPFRPNPIGLSIVEIIKIENNIINIRGIDTLDGTPLLDIKPYTKRFDYVENTKNGWQDAISDEVAYKRGTRQE